MNKEINNYYESNIKTSRNDITKLWVKFTKEREIEEFDKDVQNLYEYTIQLQEENDYYFKKNIELSTLNTSLRSDRDNYKSRNDKAIEYNYELQERYCHSALFDDLVASKIYEIAEKQLNILQGEDKE